jgi:hypothetical protein
MLAYAIIGGELVVPAASLFVLGDNRLDGPLPAEVAVGETPQLGINQRNHLIHGNPVALIP